MSLPVPKLLNQIQKLHEEAVNHAKHAVVRVIECGKLLNLLKAQTTSWEGELEKINMSRTTAWRYMRVASDAAKSPAKTKYLLEQGASLVDLYRAFDLVKPCEPGGYKSDVYQRRKAAEQLELDFSFEEFTPHIKSLIKARNVEELAPSTLQRIKAELVEAQKRIDAVLAEKGAINLENHQP